VSTIKTLRKLLGDLSLNSDVTFTLILTRALKPTIIFSLAIKFQ